MVVHTSDSPSRSENFVSCQTLPVCVSIRKVFALASGLNVMTKRPCWSGPLPGCPFLTESHHRQQAG